jgi:hypothetical protein
MSIIPDQRSWATAGSSDNNKQEICDSLSGVMEDTASVLEVASGFGTHLELLADTYKHVNFTASEAQAICLDKLTEVSYKFNNVSKPVEINMMQLPQWLSGKHYDGLLAINLLHISPYQVTTNLFKLGQDLKVKWISNYGAFKINGQYGSDGDIRFDQSLKSRDSRWGLRDVDDVKKIATEHGFKLKIMKPTKANNWFMIWVNTATPFAGALPQTP